MDNRENEESSPGWEAIDNALKSVYGDQTPVHFGTLISSRAIFGGPEVLDGFSFYRSEQGRPHWHLVTYGMSELYSKESEDAEWSGMGCEFTFRVLCDETEAEPPAWALNFVNNVAKHVIASERALLAGNRLSVGPISTDRETNLTAIAATIDPELGEIETPHGKVEFIQLVALTAEEIEKMRATSTQEVLDLIGRTNPLYITDLKRESIV